jgi:NADPH:quinone reductase-like Zn-dependent oxidoreductase
MRALILTRHGAPEVLQLRERPDLKADAGQVVIAVKRAGLNFSDVAARVGLYPDAPKPPAVLGYEVAGTIAAVGEGVTGLPVGERVVAMCRFNGQASQVVVDAAVVRRLPEVLSFDQGAALPVNYLTAYHMLFHVASLRPGDSVLIHMAAGGVGLAAIELCKRVPQVRVFGTASASKHAMLNERGVQHPIDYRSTDYAEEVRRLTDGKGVNLVLDPLGGPDWHKGYQLLRPAGHLIAFGWANMVQGDKRRLPRVVGQYLGMPRYSPYGLMGHNRTVSGVNIGHMWSELPLMSSHLGKLLDLAAAGEVKPHVDTVFPLSKGADAHRHMQARNNVGKIVFDCEA